MKLVSLAPDAALGVVRDGRVLEASALGPLAPRTMRDLLDDWRSGCARLAEGIASAPAGTGLPLEAVSLLAPVPRPGKVACAGINYRSHAAEQRREPPDHPVMFAKFASCLVGDRAEIRWSPSLTQAVDHEAELAVVIAETCRNVRASDALGFVAGYMCMNDVTARDLQYSDRQFTRAKSLDTFGPIGPWLVTADEVPDPQALAIRCLVNGETRQDANTSEMIFSVAELVSFCSQAFTLEPGDVIATGTPGGVGWFRDPKATLRDGDEVVVDIERVGRLTNVCREESI